MGKEGATGWKAAIENELAFQKRFGISVGEITVSIVFYGALIAWGVFSHFSSSGQLVYAQLRTYSPDCAAGACFAPFFGAAGALAVALWVGMFAVLALNRREPKYSKNQFLSSLLATHTVIVNAWLANRFAVVHTVLSSVIIVSGAALLPGAPIGAIWIACICVAVINIIATMNERRYLATAAKHDEWMRTTAQARAERMATLAQRAKAAPNAAGHHRSIALIQHLRRELRPTIKQMDALRSAVTVNPVVALVASLLVRALIVLAIYDDSLYITSALVAALTVFGLAFVYRVALQLVIDLPEADAGRMIVTLPLG